MERYRVDKIVGEGSFGKAFLCARIADGKACVIKQVDTSKLSRKARNLADKEATVLARLSHPNIVGFWESFLHGESNKVLCIVMDYADGGDLSSFLRRREGRLLDEEVILDWFVQTTLALKHIHDRKILHRDLKTQNIFLTHSRVVKLGDFGIAKVLAGTLDLARTAVGTPYYMSPEICQQKRYNHKSDIWSLGCVLYEMTTLRYAFEGRDVRVLTTKICACEPRPISSRYSTGLRGLLAQLLKKDPGTRPSTGSMLRRPLMKEKIGRFLNEEQMEQEFKRGAGAGAAGSSAAGALAPAARPRVPSSRRAFAGQKGGHAEGPGDARSIPREGANGADRRGSAWAAAARPNGWRQGEPKKQPGKQLADQRRAKRDGERAPKGHGQRAGIAMRKAQYTPPPPPPGRGRRGPTRAGYDDDGNRQQRAEWAKRARERAQAARVALGIEKTPSRRRSNHVASGPAAPDGAKVSPSPSLENADGTAALQDRTSRAAARMEMSVGRGGGDSDGVAAAGAGAGAAAARSARADEGSDQGATQSDGTHPQITSMGSAGCSQALAVQEARERRPLDAEARAVAPGDVGWGGDNKPKCLTAVRAVFGLDLGDERVERRKSSPSSDSCDNSDYESASSRQATEDGVVRQTAAAMSSSAGYWEAREDQRVLPIADTASRIDAKGAEPAAGAVAADLAPAESQESACPDHPNASDRLRWAWERGCRSDDDTTDEPEDKAKSREVALSQERNVRPPKSKPTPFGDLSGGPTTAEEERGVEASTFRVDLGTDKGWLHELEAKMGAIKKQVDQIKSPPCSLSGRVHGNGDPATTPREQEASQTFETPARGRPDHLSNMSMLTPDSAGATGERSPHDARHDGTAQRAQGSNGAQLGAGVAVGMVGEDAACRRADGQTSNDCEEPAAAAAAHSGGRLGLVSPPRSLPRSRSRRKTKLLAASAAVETAAAALAAVEEAERRAPAALRRPSQGVLKSADLNPVQHGVHPDETPADVADPRPCYATPKARVFEHKISSPSLLAEARVMPIVTTPAQRRGTGQSGGTPPGTSKSEKKPPRRAAALAAELERRSENRPPRRSKKGLGRAGGDEGSGGVSPLSADQRAQAMRATRDRERASLRALIAERRRASGGELASDGADNITERAENITSQRDTLSGNAADLRTPPQRRNDANTRVVTSEPPPQRSLSSCERKSGRPSRRKSVDAQRRRRRLRSQEEEEQGGAASKERRDPARRRQDLRAFMAKGRRECVAMQASGSAKADSDRREGDTNSVSVADGSSLGVEAARDRSRRADDADAAASLPRNICLDLDEEGRERHTTVQRVASSRGGYGTRDAIGTAGNGARKDSLLMMSNGTSAPQEQQQRRLSHYGLAGPEAFENSADNELQQAAGNGSRHGEPAKRPDVHENGGFNERAQDPLFPDERPDEREVDTSEATPMTYSDDVGVCARRARLGEDGFEQPRHETADRAVVVNGLDTYDSQRLSGAAAAALASDVDGEAAAEEYTRMLARMKQEVLELGDGASTDSSWGSSGADSGTGGEGACAQQGVDRGPLGGAFLHGVMGIGSNRAVMKMGTDNVGMELTAGSSNSGGGRGEEVARENRDGSLASPLEYSASLNTSSSASWGGGTGGSRPSRGVSSEGVTAAETIFLPAKDDWMAAGTSTSFGSGLRGIALVSLAQVSGLRNSRSSPHESSRDSCSPLNTIQANDEGSSMEPAVVFSDVPEIVMDDGGTGDQAGREIVAHGGDRLTASCGIDGLFRYEGVKDDDDGAEVREAVVAGAPLSLSREHAIALSEDDERKLRDRLRHSIGEERFLHVCRYLREVDLDKEDDDTMTLEVERILGAASGLDHLPDLLRLLAGSERWCVP